ncbi:MAG: hypothetical protein ACTSWN_14655 [Promethearchaeota archaeon]
MVPVCLVFAIAFVLYYTDDYLDDGHDFLFTDAYGRGFTTSWFNMEMFWGNFELWVLVGFWTGSICALLLGKKPGYKIKMARRHLKLTILVEIMIIIFVIVVTIINKFTRGHDVNVLVMLGAGWYPAYFCRHFMFMIACLSCAWPLIILACRFKRKARLISVDLPTNVIFLGIALVILHLAIITDWQLGCIIDIESGVIDIAGFSLVSIPLSIFIIGLFERQINKHDRSVRAEIKKDKMGGEEIYGVGKRLGKRLFRVVLACVAMVLLLLMLSGLANTMLVNGLDTSIEIKWTTITSSFLTWVHCGIIIAITYLLTVMGGLKIDKNG